MLKEEQIESFLNELCESIEVPKGFLKKETAIKEIAWDSLAIISCIALSDEQFNVMLSGDELSKIETIGDIITLISQKT